MTGTPVAQSFAKVYAMCRILDGGKAFGTRKDAFEAKYFTTDYMGFNLTIREGAADEILRKIAPLVHYVDVDRADVLPAILYRNVTFTMPRNTLAAYHMMRRELFAGEVEAANAAVASGKLRQLASGFLYDSETSEVLTYDTARTDCVLSVLGRMDRAVVFYEYDEQGASLLHALGDDASTDRADEPRYLIAQFRSMSHGVDGLQKIYNKAVFMHPLWSNDSFSQAVARLWRTGQEREVEIVTVCAGGSLDAIVQARVAGNATWMEMFIDHMRGES